MGVLLPVVAGDLIIPKVEMEQSEIGQIDGFRLQIIVSLKVKVVESLCFLKPEELQMLQSEAVMLLHSKI